MSTFLFNTLYPKCPNIRLTKVLGMNLKKRLVWRKNFLLTKSIQKQGEKSALFDIFLNNGDELLKSILHRSKHRVKLTASIFSSSSVTAEISWSLEALLAELEITKNHRELDQGSKEETKAKCLNLQWNKQFSAQSGLEGFHVAKNAWALSKLLKVTSEDRFKTFGRHSVTHHLEVTVFLVPSGTAHTISEREKFAKNVRPHNGLALGS